MQWMPWAERRWWRWTIADSYHHTISGCSIDSASEGTEGQHESCGHGPSDFERRRYDSSGFLPGQPRGNFDCLYLCTSRIVVTCAAQSGTRRNSRTIQGFSGSGALGLWIDLSWASRARCNRWIVEVKRGSDLQGARMR